MTSQKRPFPPPAESPETIEQRTAALGRNIEEVAKLAAVKTLEALGACDEALDWVEAQPDCNPARLWETCTHVDWMLWLAYRLGLQNQAVLAHADLVEYMLKDAGMYGVLDLDPLPRAALDTARAWILDPSDERRKQAMDAARRAVDTARAYVAARTSTAAAGRAALYLAAAYVAWAVSDPAWLMKPELKHVLGPPRIVRQHITTEALVKALGAL